MFTAATGPRMTQTNKDLIRGAHDLLVENWAINQCLDAMVSEWVITPKENQTIRAIRTESGKVEEFLRSFPRKSNDTFEKVIRITRRKNQPQIAELLLKGGEPK